MTSELGYYMSLTERRKVAKTKAKYCQYVDPKGVLCGAPLVKILPDDFYEYIAGKRKLADVRLDDRMVSGSKQHYYMSHE